MALKQLVDTGRCTSWLLRSGYRRVATLPEPARPHLLLLAWLFPPHISGGVYRPSALVKYARKRGWDVTVIAGSSSEPVTEAGQAMLDYVGGDVEIHRVTSPTLVPSYRFFPRIDGGTLNALAAVDLVIQKLSSRPSAILATGPPFHSFLAARILGRTLDTRYILDYRDEWTLCPFDFVQKSGADRWTEQYCLNRAAGIVFTTRSQLSHHLMNFTCPSGCRTTVVPNAWEPEEARNSFSPLELHSGKVNLAFIGNLSGHTPPDGFLKMLTRVMEADPRWLKRLRIYFVGQKSAASRKALSAFPHPELIVQIGQVRKSEALAIMRSMTALLLINEKALWRYLPGKIYDYLGSETPVIVFGAGGEVAQLIEATCAGVIVDDSMPASLSAALDVVAQGCRASGVAERFNAENTREATSNQMLRFLSSTDNDPASFR